MHMSPRLKDMTIISAGSVGRSLAFILLLCILTSIVFVHGELSSYVSEDHVGNEVEARLIFGKPIAKHNCSIVAISVENETIYLHEVSGSIIRVKNAIRPNISEELCLYQSAPNEGTIVVIITTVQKISGLVAFGFSNVFEISDQSLLERKTGPITLRGVHGQFGPLIHSPQKKTLKVPERVIELYLVADSFIVDQKQNNSLDYVLQLVTLADLLLRPLRLHITLVGLELWDPVSIKHPETAEKIEDTHEQVLAYRRQNVSVANSVLHFLSGKTFQLGRVGMANRRGVCRDALSIIITANSIHHTSLDAASILVHEIGHLLGLRHDENVGTLCQCDGDSVCLMSGLTGVRHAIRWSNCSLDILQTVLLKKRFPDCFKPVHLVERSKRAICGNRIQEPGEECDDTNKARDGTTCCDTDTCKLRPTSQCSHGPCCLQCQLRKAGHRCMQFINESALLEDVGWYDKDCLTSVPDQGFCDGLSSSCPTSEPKLDGSKCDKNQGICVQGQCRSLNRQCENIFGDGWQSGPDRCFEENLKGTENAGYCDYHVQLGHTEEAANYTYEACHWKDMKCGLLHCLVPEDRPGAPASDSLDDEWGPLTSTQIVTIPNALSERDSTRATTCAHGLSERKLTGMRDPGLVADGTPCGFQRFCQNGQCLRNAQWSTVQE